MATAIDFPALSKLPPQDGYEEIPVDQAVSDDTEGGGYMFSRPNGTRMVFQYHLSYRELPDADAVKMREFLRTVTLGSGVSFNWTNPVTGDQRECRFLKETGLPRIRYNCFGSSNEQVSLGSLWDVEFTLQEV